MRNLSGVRSIAALLRRSAHLESEGSMETQLWAIAIKGDRSHNELKSEVAEMASVSSFRIPSDKLRVGTLDSLMSLSDDLAKMDILAEATVAKLYKQLLELRPDDEPTIIGGARRRRWHAAAAAAPRGGCCATGALLLLSVPARDGRPLRARACLRTPMCAARSRPLCRRSAHRLVHDDAVGVGRGEVPAEDAAARSLRQHLVARDLAG